MQRILFMLSCNGKLRKACITSNAVSGITVVLRSAYTMQGQHHRGDRHGHDHPTFWPPFKKRMVISSSLDTYVPILICITKSTSVLIHKDPIRVIPNPFSEKFTRFVQGVGCFTAQLYTSATHFIRAGTGPAMYRQ